MIINNGYLVLACGCTDCFPVAIFFDEESANNYGTENCCNPEGYIVRKINVSSLELTDD